MNRDVGATLRLIEPRVWLVPMLALVAAAALFVTNSNQRVFLWLNQLGPLTGKGSGLLIMAIVGGAILPVAQGALADSIGIHTAFLMPALCYLYIVYYGFAGSRVVRPD